MAVEYRIEFTIQGRGPDDEDFKDIGFGSSGAWDTPSQCSHMVGSAIDNYDWETSPDMPDPGAIKAAITRALTGGTDD